MIINKKIHSHILSVLYILLILFLTVSAYSRKKGSTISCFTCSSRNETNKHCHDPFNPAMINYTESCRVPKHNHIGVFPARFCVKVIGKTEITREELVIRACSLENMDNQCGNFRFEKEIIKGCILTCDYDGCNGAMNINDHETIINLIIQFTITLLIAIILQ